MNEIPFETLTRYLHRTSTQLSRMDDVVEAQGVDLADVKMRVNALLSWGRVKAVNPLAAELQGGFEVQPGYSLIDPAGLAVDDLVLIGQFYGRVILLGKIWVTT